MHTTLPEPIFETLTALEQAGFKAYIVGGSLRDLLLGRPPKDWDLTTDAQPGAVQKLFPDSVYENTFGTVGVKVARFLPSTPDTHEHDIIEVTTFRTERTYSDGRHPDTVAFVTTVEADLARRDFTVNAMAGQVTGTAGSVNIEIIDPFGGQSDIQKKRSAPSVNPRNASQKMDCVSCAHFDWSWN